MNNKRWLKSAGLAVCMLVSASSFAGMITDVEPVNKKINWLQSTSWTHNLNDNVDIFDLGSAVSATLSIEFWDDKRDPRWARGEIATIVVGIIDFQDGALIYNPVSTWGGSLGVNSLAGLNDDGLLNIKVWSDWGDFYIGDSILEVITRDRVAVPEPGTIALLSLGMCGLLASRKLAR